MKLHSLFAAGLLMASAGLAQAIQNGLQPMEFDLMFSDPAWNVRGTFTGNVMFADDATGSFSVYFPTVDVDWTVNNPATGAPYRTTTGWSGASVLNFENNQAVSGYFEAIGRIDELPGAWNTIYYVQGEARLIGGLSNAWGEPKIHTPFYSFTGPATVTVRQAPESGSTLALLAGGLLTLRYLKSRR